MEMVRDGELSVSITQLEARENLNRILCKLDADIGRLEQKCSEPGISDHQLRIMYKELVNMRALHDSVWTTLSRKEFAQTVNDITTLLQRISPKDSADGGVERVLAQLADLSSQQASFTLPNTMIEPSVSQAEFEEFKRSLRVVPTKARQAVEAC